MKLKPITFHNSNALATRGMRRDWDWKHTTTRKFDAVQEREVGYRFFAHFHPYAGAFTQRLIQKSIRGLQAIDTEYVRHPDGTFAVQPGSVRVRLADGAPVALEDGTRLLLDGGVTARLPGLQLGKTPNGLILKGSDGKLHTVIEGDSVKLVETVTVRRPDGEMVTLDGTTTLTLHDSLPRPLFYQELFNARTYQPNKDLVGTPWPVKDIDFTSSGAYAVYNWELFYHVPLLIATHLSKNGRYVEAQRWLHHIFDPTDDSEGPTPERFWRVKPFQSTEVRKVEEILVNLATGADEHLSEQTVQSMEASRERPFRPHVIADYRPSARMLKTVMAYLDNLIAWGDSLFRQDTRETVDEAIQLYILAANILGPRPQAVPPKGTARPMTYEQLRGKMKEGWAALVDLETAIPFDTAPWPGDASENHASGVTRSIGQTLYFCVPRNDKLLAYWDTVADRLFKIRNSLNFQGIFRQLALFDPPIDPALLVRAAAAGLDLGAILSGVNQPPPLVRFALLVQKAGEICHEVKALGGALLSAIEKEDNEAIALLRAQHERVILGLVESVRYGQWQEAIKAREGLEQSLANAAQRYVYYERQLGRQESEIKIPELDALDAAELLNLKLKVKEPGVPLRPVEVNIDSNAGDGKKISSHEVEEMELLSEAQTLQDAAAIAEGIAAGLALVPKFGGKIQPFGAGVDITFGGDELARNLSLGASVARAIASRNTYEAGKASRIGSYARREQEWAFQSNAAAGEITQTLKQLRAAQIREAIAKREWDNHKQQIKNSEEIEHFLEGESTPVGDRKHKKTSTLGFYAWQRREAKSLYNQAFQLAYDVAAKAERALRHELGDSMLSYLQYGYLAGKEGLFAGEKLALDLKRMEMAYHELNRREYELTNHVSLLQVDPIALIQLRTTGRCTFSLPEELFDLDGPGHYFRRLKSVALSLPCVTGPYTSINCTLTLLKSSVRKNTLVNGSGYADQGSEDSRFDRYFGSLQSIVTSSGLNDSGLFETNLRDERYLPFEGSGVLSEWQLELPAAVRQFDYDTISDVVLHLRYTSRQGGETLRAPAVASLEEKIKKAEAAGSVRLLSVRHEFPTQWAKFISQPGTAPFELSLPLREEHYPFWSTGRLGKITETKIFARTGVSLALKIAGNDVALGKDERFGELRFGTDTSERPSIGKLDLSFDSKKIDDLWIAVAWKSK